MGKIMDGKETAGLLRAKITKEVADLKSRGIEPGLAVVLVGENSASKIYVRNKQRACKELGIYSEEHLLSENASEDELLSLIDRLNCDSKINGILVQLPLPEHISEKKVIERINPAKDVDAFSEVNTGKIFLGEEGFKPCTPAGIMELLKRYEIETKGKNCVIIGRSNIVGKPMAMLMLGADSTVTVCHSKTPDIKAHTLNADIIIAAVGKANFLTADMVKEGAVVIDVGMNRNSEGKLCGDVDYAGVAEKASYITPVPGGVGPMTITMLMENTVTAAKHQNGIK